MNRTPIFHKPPCGRIPLATSITRRSSRTSVIDSSDDVLESADQLLGESYSEWLEVKNKELKVNRKLVKEKREKEENEAAQVQVVKRERSQKVVENWKLCKEKLIKDKLKREKEEIEKIALENEQLIERQQCSIAAATKWREDKSQLLREQQQQKKKKLKEQEEKKLEDLKLKRELSVKAFQVWCENKDKSQKELHNVKCQELKQKMHTSSIEKQEKQQLAQNAFMAWKSIKDKQIEKTKTLFSYKHDPRQPPKNNKWSPARNIKYTYPVDPTIKSTMTTKDTYSQHSFESDVESIDTRNGSIDENEHSAKTGQLKTVAVCCQTLEFLCTCEGQNNNSL